MAEAFSVTVKGAKALERDLKRLRKFTPVSNRDLNAMAEIWKTAIKRRTLKGVDADKKSFIPYSPNYAAYRSSTGHKVKPVNLFYKGHMLASMAHHVSPGKIRIYFRTVKEGLKAHGHHYGSSKTGLPRRPFFALNAEDIGQAVSYLERRYGRELNR